MIKTFGKIGKGLKVVVDSANATGGVVAPKLYREMGCEVIELYSMPDGRFPHHHPNPSDEKTLNDIKKAVVENNADAASAVAVFMETEPEVMVSAIVETVSNQAEATKDAAAGAAEATQNAAAEAVNKTVEDTKAAVNKKVEDTKAAVNQKAEETKAAAKQKANEAVDNAAKDVKKGLGL
jgi:hypothetical protein